MRRCQWILKLLIGQKLFPNAMGSYTVMVGGKPMRIIVQEGHVPLSQSSSKRDHFIPESPDKVKDDREKLDDVVPDSMEMDNSKSLYSNDELKTWWY